jgi:predicted GNAT family acetyltransferase
LLNITITSQNKVQGVKETFVYLNVRNFIINYLYKLMDYNIINNTTAKRFELTIDGRTAIVTYKLFDGGISFLHTEVPVELEGKGIGSAMAKYVLEYAKTNNLKVFLLCPFIKTYVDRHIEYQALLKHTL